MTEDRHGKFTEQMLTATFDFAKLALSSLILLNSGAATALLAYLAGHGSATSPAPALFAFSIGAALGGASALCAYLGQRLNWDLVRGRAVSRKLTDFYLKAAISSGVIGYALFVVGCVTASMAVTSTVLGAHASPVTRQSQADPPVLAPDTAALSKNLLTAAQRPPALTLAGSDPRTQPHIDAFRLSIDSDGLLAGFTALLFIATAWLVFVTRDGSRRQLRAYVLVKGCVLTHRQDGSQWHAQLEIKNFGQTPAYDLTSYMGTTVSNYPLNVTLPEPPAMLRQSKSIVAPDNHELYVVPVDKPSSEQWDLIRREQGAVYVWGCVNYRDAFKVRRHVTFRLMLTGNGGCDSGRFVNCAEGNIAN